LFLGNLTVSGTTTSINTETLTLDDNIIILNNNATGDPSENAGIEVERGSSTNVALRWNESSDKWEFTNDGTTYADIQASITAGSGLNKAANTISIASANSNRIVINANDIDLATVAQSNTVGSPGISFVQSQLIDSYGRISGTTSADIRTASTSVTGIASFNPSTFQITSGQVSIAASGITNSQLANSNVIINGTTIQLGASETITANAQTLSGTTLAPNVLNSILTSVATITSGTWQGSAVGVAYGGTGSTTASGAINTLLPSQTNNEGKFLTSASGLATWSIIIFENINDVVFTSKINGDFLRYDSTLSKWKNATATIDDLSDVTITSAASSQFLKWNGTAWVNDAIDLGTDTTGNYMSDLTAGTGITITHTPAEGSNATIAVTPNTYQPLDSELTAIAGLTSENNKLPYFTGSGTAAVTDITSTARSLIDDASISEMRATLDLEIGIDVQAYDPDLAALAGLTDVITFTEGVGELPYFTAAGTAALTDITTAARSILDDTSTSAIRTTLGVGTSDSPTFAGATLDAVQVGITAAGEIDTTSGNLTIDSAGGTVTVDDNLTVTGNLTVSGTTTTVNTETVTINDNIIVLNNNSASEPTENAGIEVERGDVTNVALRWNESSDRWELTNDGTTYANIVTSSSTDTLTSKTLTSPVINTSITTGSSSVDLFTSTATTVNFANAATTFHIAGAATAINIANTATGAQVLNLGSASTGESTYNIGTGATGASTTKILNLGTNGAVSSTTNINIGSANGGTITLNSPTVTISGNLTVSGTTTTINTATLNIADNQIVLNSDVTGAPTENAGVTVERGTSTDVDIRWNETSDLWEITEDGTNYDLLSSRTLFNQQTASYTLIRSDKNKIVEMSATSGLTLTVPADNTVDYPVGSEVRILQTNTGQVTLAGAVGVTVNATPGLKLRAQWSSATLVKRAANTWVALGDLAA